MEAARGSQGTVEGSKCPPSFACQLSAFPGQCPPVVRLLFLFSVFARQFVFPVPCPPVVRLPCTLPTSSPPSQDPAHQLSAFPGLCPPVVGLPWTLPASCPPSLDPARQLFVDPARQLSAFPARQLSAFPRTLPASCPPSLDLARQFSAFTSQSSEFRPRHISYTTLLCCCLSQESMRSDGM